MRPSIIYLLGMDFIYLGFHFYGLVLLLCSSILIVHCQDTGNQGASTDSNAGNQATETKTSTETSSSTTTTDANTGTQSSPTDSTSTSNDGGAGNQTPSTENKTDTSKTGC